MGRAQEITEYVKKYDPLLFCESREGKLCILRKSKRVESYEYNGSKIDWVRPDSYIVFALTDNWSIHGQSVDRGVLTIWERLRYIDIWNNRDLAKESMDSVEKVKANRSRDVDNHMESYLKDNAKEFARATSDIRTCNMNTKIKGDF